MSKPFIGRWRILEMDVWDREYIDLVVPGFIEFERGNSGSFQFGTVSGGIDWRLSLRDAAPAVEWCWDGWSDADPGSGRGWAAIAGSMLEGHIYIFGADDSGFTAQRMKPRAKKIIRTPVTQRHRFGSF